MDINDDELELYVVSFWSYADDHKRGGLKTLEVAAADLDQAITIVMNKYPSAEISIAW